MAALPYERTTDRWTGERTLAWRAVSPPPLGLVQIGLPGFQVVMHVLVSGAAFRFGDGSGASQASQACSDGIQHASRLQVTGRPGTLVGAQQAPEGEMEATVKLEPRWTLQFRPPGPTAATWNPSMQFMDP
jgi:hypothetical protein